MFVFAAVMVMSLSLCGRVIFVVTVLFIMASMHMIFVMCICDMLLTISARVAVLHFAEVPTVFSVRLMMVVLVYVSSAVATSMLTSVFVFCQLQSMVQNTLFEHRKNYV